MDDLRSSMCGTLRSSKADDWSASFGCIARMADLIAPTHVSHSFREITPNSATLVRSFFFVFSNFFSSFPTFFVRRCSAFRMAFSRRIEPRCCWRPLLSCVVSSDEVDCCLKSKLVLSPAACGGDCSSSSSPSSSRPSSIHDADVIPEQLCAASRSPAGDAADRVYDSGNEIWNVHSPWLGLLVGPMTVQPGSSAYDRFALG
mmetsp:Transcript_36988/g.96939  ORF Transcript_36988/g.96939 Transcript_36988/m.96939 type:complete len:202 (+) Transcript_36988:2126-2731(+)